MTNKELIEMMMKLANLAKSNADELSTSITEVVKILENEKYTENNSTDTNTDSLTKIRKIIDNLDHTTDRRISEDDWSIIRACLMKRIPRRPKNSIFKNFLSNPHEYKYCRICHNLVTNDYGAEYCQYCGQHIDWSELDE